MTSHAWPASGVALALAATLSFACQAAPTAPSPPAGVNPLQLPLGPRQLTFPSGPALLHVWGYSWWSDRPLCEPLLGTRHGSSVSAVVSVATDDAGWLVRDPAGGLELRITQTGQSAIEGEGLAGTARGVMRDAPPVPFALARDLEVNLSVEGPTAVAGLGSAARPYFQGTMTGVIRYTDSSGGVITCPLVFWSLSTMGP